MSSTTHLFLSTLDAVNPNCPSQANWNINWSSDHSGSFTISVESVAFPNAIFSVNSNYNTIIFDEGAADLTATLTSQQYTGTSLATEVALQMNAAGADTYTCTYDTQTFKILITNTTDTFQVTAGTALDVCGLTVMSAAAASLQGLNPVRLDGTMYVDFICSLGKSSYSSNMKTNNFYRIPVTTEIGSMVYYQSTNPDQIKLQSGRLSQFNIRLYDDHSNLWTLPSNCDISIVLVLTHVV